MSNHEAEVKLSSGEISLADYGFYVRMLSVAVGEPITANQVSDGIGVTWHTAKKRLSQLEKAGLVKAEGRKFVSQESYLRWLDSEVQLALEADEKRHQTNSPAKIEESQAETAALPEKVQESKPTPANVQELAPELPSREFQEYGESGSA